mmetsp:Transcript_607/g.2045  ORF Transcript_607/g.2045 Transcript_607/m.2045 type:complete len:151 (-) Transcript_607:120-572(-)
MRNSLTGGDDTAESILQRRSSVRKRRIWELDDNDDLFQTSFQLAAALLKKDNTLDEKKESQAPPIEEPGHQELDQAKAAVAFLKRKRTLSNLCGVKSISTAADEVHRARQNAGFRLSSPVVSASNSYDILLDFDKDPAVPLQRHREALGE